MHNLSDKHRNNNLSVHHISSHGDYAAVLLKTQTFNQPQHFSSTVDNKDVIICIYHSVSCQLTREIRLLEYPSTCPS